MPSIDWRTYLAGSLASISVIVALHIMFAPYGNPDWFRLISQAAVAGPLWAHLTLVFLAIRRQRRIFSITKKKIVLALILALLMPLGVINDTPIPWIYFFLLEFFYPEFSHEVLLVFGAIWMAVWLVLLGPAFALPSRRERHARIMVVALSLAYGVIPSLTLLFQGIGVS